MKVRLDGKSIRLRLSASEVSSLASTGQVSTSTAFPNAAVLCVRLESAEVPALTAAFETGTVRIALPSEAAREWADSDRTGFHASVDGLDVIVEKDLDTCSGPRLH